MLRLHIDVFNHKIALEAHESLFEPCLTVIWVLLPFLSKLRLERLLEAFPSVFSLVILFSPEQKQTRQHYCITNNAQFVFYLI